MSKVGEESLLKSLVGVHGPGCWQSDALLDLVEERDSLASYARYAEATAENGMIPMSREAWSDTVSGPRRFGSTPWGLGNIRWWCSETEGHVEVTLSAAAGESRAFSAQLGAEEVDEFVATLVRILEKEQA